MKRRLMVLRHAKASDIQGGGDHLRPLTQKGIADATAMGELLKKEGLVPDVVLTSDALRTRQTTENVIARLGNPKVLELPELYGCAPEVYLECIAIYAPAARMPLIVGHNPAVEEFTSAAAGTYTHMKTASLALFELQGDDPSNPEINTDAGVLRILRPQG